MLVLFPYTCCHFSTLPSLTYDVQIQSDTRMAIFLRACTGHVYSVTALLIKCLYFTFVVFRCIIQLYNCTPSVKIVIGLFSDERLQMRFRRVLLLAIGLACESRFRSVLCAQDLDKHPGIPEIIFSAVGSDSRNQALETSTNGGATARRLAN